MVASSEAISLRRSLAHQMLKPTFFNPTLSNLFLDSKSHTNRQRQDVVAVDFRKEDSPNLKLLTLPLEPMKISTTVNMSAQSVRAKSSETPKSGPVTPAGLCFI